MVSGNFDNKAPLISIVTATFNTAKYIHRLIDSLRSQTNKNFEWVVADGGSTDGTLEILSQVDDMSLVVDSRPDLGIYDAWNRALGLASGEWVCFLGADDLIMPEAITTMLDFESNASVPHDFICGRVELFHGETLLKTIGRPWSWSRFKKYMCVAHTGSLQRKSYFHRYGNFDPSFKISGDYEILLRCGKHLSAGFVNEVVARMQIGGQSNDNVLVFSENLRARLMHGVTTPVCGKIHSKWAEIKWRTRRVLGSV